MHSKKPKQPSYQELRETWYKKLTDSGFEDIETNDFNLKSSANKFAKRKNLYDKSEYFYMARQFLNDYKFESKREQVIWEYWAEGMSVRDIAETLQKTKVVPRSFDRNKVWVIVKHLKGIMLKMYLVKDGK